MKSLTIIGEPGEVLYYIPNERNGLKHIEKVVLKKIVISEQESYVSVFSPYIGYFNEDFDEAFTYLLESREAAEQRYFILLHSCT